MNRGLTRTWGLGEFEAREAAALPTLAGVPVIARDFVPEGMIVLRGPEKIVVYHHGQITTYDTAEMLAEKPYK